MIIVARFIQGAAGGIFPLAFGIVRDEFPREKVAGSIGLLSAILGVGARHRDRALGRDRRAPQLPLAVLDPARRDADRRVSRPGATSPNRRCAQPGKVNWLAAALMTIGHLDGAARDLRRRPTWGWGSPKTLGLIARRPGRLRRVDRSRGAQRQPADRHDDDADPRRVDDQPRRVPARRRHVRVVHRLPAVRAAAEEHRLRLRRLGRRLRPVPAALDDRDDDPGPVRRANLGALRLARGAARGAPRSRPRRSRCSPSNTATPTTC